MLASHGCCLRRLTGLSMLATGSRASLQREPSNSLQMRWRALWLTPGSAFETIERVCQHPERSPPLPVLRVAQPLGLLPRRPNCRACRRDFHSPPAFRVAPFAAASVPVAAGLVLPRPRFESLLGQQAAVS